MIGSKATASLSPAGTPDDVAFVSSTGGSAGDLVMLALLLWRAAATDAVHDPVGRRNQFNRRCQRRNH